MALGALALGVACAVVAVVLAATAKAPSSVRDAAAEQHTTVPAAGLPGWAAFDDSLLSCDLDGDGLPEALVLQGGRLRVYGHVPATSDAGEAPAGEATGSSSSGGRTVETSTLSWEDGLSVCAANGDWLVSRCMVGDIDHGGTPEVVLLVWAPGSYGPSRPFWVGEDTDDYCEHVYVLRYDEGRLVPLWMSSALGVEATDATLDAGGRLWLTSRDGEASCWSWESWGLALQEEASPDDAAATADGTTSLSLLCVGDNIVHRILLDGARGDDGSYDFSSVYADVAPWVRGFDVAAVCQEAPLLEHPEEGSHVWGAPYALGDALADAGFDLVLNATNHVGDFGDEALADELGFWRTHHPGVHPLGVHVSADEARYEVVSENGVTLALFDYTQSTGRGSRLSPQGDTLVDQLADEDRLREDLSSVEGTADLSLCFLHTGPEGQALPDEAQRALCERLVDAGADVVVCSHSHTVMPCVRLVTARGNAGIVCYGLGNFVSASHGATSVLGSAAALTVGVTAGNGSRHVEADVRTIPLVCHVDAAGTRVLPLASYTDDLAHDNLLLGDGEDATSLLRLWLATCVSAQGLR